MTLIFRFLHKSLLGKLQQEGLVNKDEILSIASDFYATSIDYLEEWAGYLSEFVAYDWFDLSKEIPVWKQMEQDVGKMVSKVQASSFTTLNDNSLYDQTSQLRSFITSKVLKLWKEDQVDTGMRRVEVFRNFKESENAFSELPQDAEYFLCLPGTNASADRVFSRIFGTWTDEKTQITKHNLRASVRVDYNLNLKCAEFHEYISKDRKLLQDVHSSAKYSNEASNEGQSDTESVEEMVL